MKTALYSHPDFLLHRSTSAHPERPERLQVLGEHLRHFSGWKDLDQRTFEPATWAELEMCHSPAMIERVREAVEGGFDIDGDTYTNGHS